MSHASLAKSNVLLSRWLVLPVSQHGQSFLSETEQTTVYGTYQFSYCTCLLSPSRCLLHSKSMKAMYARFTTREHGLLNWSAAPISSPHIYRHKTSRCTASWASSNFTGKVVPESVGSFWVLLILTIYSTQLKAAPANSTHCPRPHACNLCSTRTSAQRLASMN
jgi:hypothetical protein